MSTETAVKSLGWLVATSRGTPGLPGSTKIRTQDSEGLKHGAEEALCSGYRPE